MCKSNHNPSITRANAHLFPCASLHGAHKTILPGQPGLPIQHTWLLREAGHKLVEPNKNEPFNICQTSPKYSNHSQINKIIGKEDHSSVDNDITVVYSNWTKNACKRVMKKELQTPTDFSTQEQLDTFSIPMHQWLTTNYQQIPYTSPFLMVTWMFPSILASWTYHNSLLLHNLPILYLTVPTHLSYLSINCVIQDTELNMMPPIVLSTTTTTQF